VSNTCQTETTFAFCPPYLGPISVETVTRDDVNIIATEKVNPDNIVTAVGILFYMPYKPK